MPKTILVGLPEAAVKESTHRVERAMVNSGFQRPSTAWSSTWPPAELPKQAASFDLPITLGVLAGSGQLTSDRFEQYAVVGELSLEGRTRPAKGTLSMAISAAQQKDCADSSCPIPTRPKRRWSRSWRSSPCLAEAAAFFAGHLDIDPVPSRLQELFNTLSHYDDDYSDVRGQELAKRALVIAAAGRTTCSCSVRPVRVKPSTWHDALPSILPPALSWTFRCDAAIPLEMSCCSPPPPRTKIPISRHHAAALS